MGTQARHITKQNEGYLNDLVIKIEVDLIWKAMAVATLEIENNMTVIPSVV